MSDKDLLSLLEISRENNLKLGVTGMLLYKHRNFIQVLEGPEDSVKLLREKICKDPRHKDIITLVEKEVSECEFGQWSMGFKHLDEALEQIPGYTDFLLTNDLSREEALAGKSALELLKRFKQLP